MAPPDAVWKSATSIAVKGPIQNGTDVSRAFVQAWPFAGPPSDEAVDPRPYVHRTHNAGWGGLLAGMPGLVLAFALPLERPAVFASLAPVLRFERLGKFEPIVNEAAQPEVWFGLLPEGTSRAAAECALAGAVPCKDKLKVGATREIKGEFVRLAAVDDGGSVRRSADLRPHTPGEKRFAVLIGRTAPSVEVPLGLRTVGPAWIELPPEGALAHGQGKGPQLAGTLERRGTATAWRFAAP